MVDNRWYDPMPIFVSSDGIPTARLDDEYSTSDGYVRCQLEDDMMNDVKYSAEEDGKYHVCSVIVNNHTSAEVYTVF